MAISTVNIAANSGLVEDGKSVIPHEKVITEFHFLFPN
jgi:hypothetical protein